jgi:hypothetical protein
VGQDSILLVNGDIVSGTGEGTGYQWAVYGDTDPFINWSFEATPVPRTDPSVPFVYDMTIPVDPVTYTVLINLASLTLSDIGVGTNPTTVSSITIDGYVPSSTLIPEVSLTGGPVVAANGGTNSAAFGPIQFNQTFTDPGDMRIRLSFLLNSPDFDGSAAFTGQLALLAPSQIPEPGTSALLGLGLVGVALFRYKRREC